MLIDLDGEDFPVGENVVGRGEIREVVTNAEVEVEMEVEERGLDHRVDGVCVVEVMRE